MSSSDQVGQKRESDPRTEKQTSPLEEQKVFFAEQSL